MFGGIDCCVRSCIFDCIVCGIGRFRCCVVVLCSLNVFGFVNGLLRSGNKPQRGDTPAKPRAQALG